MSRVCSLTEGRISSVSVGGLEALGFYEPYLSARVEGFLLFISRFDENCADIFKVKSEAERNVLPSFPCKPPSLSCCKKKNPAAVCGEDCLPLALAA